MREARSMDQVTQVREKIDIVSLISEYLPLKKAGRNFKINCPFHTEKTPSFTVSPERQIWHCFGCQKGGDCFTFLMEYENLEFPEALRILAKKVGIELQQTPFETGVSSKKEKIYALNQLACDFYHYLLLKHNVGKKALKYLLEKRRIKMPVINTFRLGFAPGLGNALSNYLIVKKKYKKQDLMDAGLASLRDERMTDFFTNRIMFPLFDHRGNVVGFSGRIIDLESVGQDSKYINTRETLVYHKGSVFFGLNIAKNEIKKEGRAIIMEGEFDVISSFQEGLTTAVAVKGTALTEDQVNLISRFTKTVSLCFDQDKAGMEALKRSLKVLEEKGLSIAVIVLPFGKDADEAIKKDTISFKKAVGNEVGIYDFLLSRALGNFDQKTAEGKKKIGDELLPFFAQIENEIIKEFYLKKLSLELEASYETLIRQIEKFKKEAKGFIQSSPSQTGGKRERIEVLEEYLLSLILQAENLKVVLEKARGILSGFRLQSLAHQKILDYLVSYLANQEVFASKKFSETLPPELVAAFDTCYLFPLPKFQNEEKYQEEVVKMAEELKILSLRKRIKILGEKIKDKEKEGKEEELQLLKKEFTGLVSLLSR